MTSRHLFLELLKESPVSLAHVALLAVQILKQDSPSASATTQNALLQLNELINQAREASAQKSAGRLVEYLGSDLGYAGDTENYYAPENSDLAHVMTHRRGIPITLAVLYIEVGNAIGLDVRGIGFPGHFLVGLYSSEIPAAKQELNLIDPFTAQLISREECIENLRNQQAGLVGAADWPPGQIESWFQPASPVQIVLRLLENLKQIYLRENSSDPAIAALELQLLIAPESSELQEQHSSLISRVYGGSESPPVH